MRRTQTALWHNRDWLLLWSGQLVSAIGTRVSLLAFPLLTLGFTGSPAQAGLIGALRGVPSALLALPAGALVDRWDRKRIMLVCDAGRALALGSIGLALALGRLSLAHLALVALIEGAFSTFFSLAETASLPRVVPRESLATATALDQATDASSGLVGPALGGALYAIGAAVPFVVDAVSYAVSLVSLLFMRTRFQEVRQPLEVRRKLRDEILEGLRWVGGQPLVVFLAVLHAGVNLCGFGYVLILIVLAEQLGASPFETGLILAAGGGGALVGSLLVGPLEQHFGRGAVLIGSTWLLALTWLTYAFAPTTLLLGLANLIACLTIPIYMAAVVGFRLAITPDALQGRVGGVFRLVSLGLQPLSLVLTGALLQTFGGTTTIVVLFVPQVVLAVAATFNRGLRETRAVLST